MKQQVSQSIAKGCFGGEAEDVFGEVGDALAMENIAFAGGAVGDFAGGIGKFDCEIAKSFDARSFSRTDIEGFAFASSVLGGGDIGGDDIFDGDEVSGLFACSVNGDGSVSLGAVGENADNAAIG